MKLEHKVIALSIIIGLFVWVIDAVLDYLYFYKEPFQSVLIPDVPSFELYIRITWMAFLLIFGIIASRIIAKRKQTEEKLRKSEERFRQITESTGEWIWEVDADGLYTYSNLVIEKILGYKQQEIIGKRHFYDLIAPDVREELKKSAFETFSRKESFRGFINPNMHKNGDIVILETSGLPILDERGNLLGYRGADTDITERRHAEEALKKERDKAQRYFNIAGTALVVIGADQKVSLINKKGCEILGYKENEIVGKNWFDIFIPERIGDNIKAVFNKLMAEEIEPVEFYENLVLTRSGEERLIAWHNSILKDETGRIIAILGSGEDITEHRRAEEALRESEIRYRKLVEFSPDAIGIHSEGKIVFINAAGAKLFGALSPEQLIGKSVLDFVHPDYKEIARERIRLMGEEGKNVSPVEETFIKLDGSVIDVEVIAMPFTYQGKPGIQVIIRDITERKRAEEALKQSEEKYHTLIDNIQDGVFIIQDGKIQFANESFARIAGYTVEEVIGKDFQELVAPEDLKIVTDRYYRRQAGEDVPKEYEFHVLHKDGVTRMLINTNVGLITFRSGVALMGTAKDITEKKRLESQLLLAQRMESVGTLASGIAHDINNVLTPIMLSQELLQERLTDEESQRLLNTIERSTQRGANLMKQVQSFAKGAKGERNALQVAPIISEIREIAEETFPRTIEIRTDIPKDLWTISGDATQLHQIIMNLCVNARDAMSDGGILSISAENLLIDEDYAHINTEAKIGPYIVITVSDTGTGIPPEVMDRIFEPFFTTKEHGKGTGLGLSISLGIVKSHGGFITVYSEIGKGTAFKVYLPAITTVETLKAQEHQHELPAGHGESILVVDDEDQILEITKKTLEKHGYKVITANDGKEAIALYLQHTEEIKLVLMDMMMPAMNGSASIRELYKVNPEIKIIAVSGLTEKDKLAKVNDIHVQAFLSKPYAAEKLLSTIHDIISSK